MSAGADLGFLEGGLIQGTNLYGGDVLHMLELGGVEGMPPGKILK